MFSLILMNPSISYFNSELRICEPRCQARDTWPIIFWEVDTLRHWNFSICPKTRLKASQLWRKITPQTGLVWFDGHTVNEVLLYTLFLLAFSHLCTLSRLLEEVWSLSWGNVNKSWLVSQSWLLQSSSSVIHWKTFQLCLKFLAKTLGWVDSRIWKDFT